MASITIKPITSKPEWERFLATHPEANFLHSWNWGEFHQKLGHSVHRLGFYHRGLQGVLLAIVESAKRARYLTVPGGPIIDWQDQEALQLFKQAIIKLAQQENCSFIRVRPQIQATDANYHLFTKLGFRPAPMYLHAELTHQLDLSQPESKLLAQMRKATRYEIKQAAKLGIQITASANPEGITDFYALQIQTAKRQEFVGFSQKYLKEQFRVFAQDNQTLLYTAKLNHQVLAQALIIFYGREADYHYGASSEAGRHYPGSYAIQWGAIKAAKNRGMDRYNFWGVAPADQPHHRFAGVSIFKRGFGGMDFAYLPAHDLVVNWTGYIFNWLVETLRKSARRL